MFLPRFVCILFTSLALGGIAGAQTVTTIRFDDIPTFSKPLEQYSGLGVHFSNGGYGVVVGTGLGDPGNWQLNGTDGTNFLGFTPYYGLSQIITLDLPATNFSLDVSKAYSGAATFYPYDFTLNAYDAGHVLVGTKTVSLITLNSWTNVSLSAAAITEIDFSSSNNFGVDHLQFTQTTAVPEPAVFAAGAGLLAFGFVLFRRRRAD